MNALAVALWLTVSAGPPWYERPATPAEDLKLLRAQVASRRLDQPFWLQRLLVYTEMGELLDAAPLVEELGAAFPGRPEFQEARMMVLSLGARHAEAAALGERILREQPGYLTIRPNLARVYLKAGRRADGVNMMFSALESGPVRVPDWELFLRALGVGTEKPETLVARLEAKSKAAPELKSLKYVLVVVSTRLGQYERARRILEENPELAAHPDLRRFLDDARAGASRETPAPATGEPR